MNHGMISLNLVQHLKSAHVQVRPILLRNSMDTVGTHIGECGIGLDAVFKKYPDITKSGMRQQ